MTRYSKGKKAWGICDRTGFRYPLKDLVYEYENGVRTGRRVGRDMVDPDHPQNDTGRVNTSDPQSLYDPRPDTRDDIGLFGFNPVGNPATYLTISTGKVTIAISAVDPVDGDIDLEGDAAGSLELEGDASGLLELEG